MKRLLALVLCIIICTASFNCVFAADALSVVSASPAEGATGITNISTDNEIYNDTKWVEIEFSEAVEPSTVTNQTIVIASSGSNLAWETFKLDGNTVKIDISQLASETTYIVTVNSGVTTSAGAALAADYSFSFTTGIIIPVASDDNKTIVNVAEGKPVSSINEGVEGFSIDNLSLITDGIDNTGFFYMSNKTGADTTAQAVIDLGQKYTILAVEYILPSTANIKNYSMAIAGRVSDLPGDDWDSADTSLKNLAGTLVGNEYGIGVYSTEEAKTPRTLVYAGTEFERSGRYVGFSGTLKKDKKIGTFEFKAYAQITTSTGEGEGGEGEGGEGEGGEGEGDGSEQPGVTPDPTKFFDVTSTSPANGATGITNINEGTNNDTKFVEIEFSEDIANANLEKNIIIKNAAGTAIDFDIYKAEGKKVMIDISSFASNTTYTVTMGKNITSQSGAGLNEYSFGFTTGIIIPVASAENKSIVNVARNKPYVCSNYEEVNVGDTLVDGNTTSSTFYLKNTLESTNFMYAMVDLQNTYEILAIRWYTNTGYINFNGSARISKDAATFLADASNAGNLKPASNTVAIGYGDVSINKSPITLVYKGTSLEKSGRYVGFAVKATNNNKSVGMFEFEAYAQVEYNISAMSAAYPDGTVKTKYSDINTATANTEISFSDEKPYEFTENGTYTFTTDIANYSETGSSYMIIAAAYDSNGNIKEIACDKQFVNNGSAVTLTAAVTAYADTAKVSAVVITSFEKAGMLLDGFELTRASAQ